MIIKLSYFIIVCFFFVYDRNLVIVVFVIFFVCYDNYSCVFLFIFDLGVMSWVIIIVEFVEKYVLCNVVLNCVLNLFLSFVFNVLSFVWE